MGWIWCVFSLLGNVGGMLDIEVISREKMLDWKGVEKRSLVPRKSIEP